MSDRQQLLGFPLRVIFGGTSETFPDQRRGFQVRVHDAGTVIPKDVTVDFTVTDSRLSAPPDFGGQVIRPLEGKSDLLPYSITVVDDDGWLTSRIFDGGVPSIIGRLAEVRVKRGSDDWETVDIRRISSVRGGSEPEYQIELSDEQWIGRGDILFEANDTLQLVPQMPEDDWFLLTGGEKTDPLATGTPGLVRAVSGEFVLIQSGGPRIDPEVRRAGLEEDIIDNPAPSNTDGNFETLRFEDENGVTHPVVSFSSLSASSKTDVLGLDWKTAPEDTNPIMPDFWVHWPTHGFSVDDNVGPWRLLWPDGLPTSETMPYLIGKPEGTDYPIGEFLRDIYEGVYGGEPLRFHQPSLDALRDLGRANGNWWVVTGEVSREEFLAQLYRAHLIAPLTEADGSIAPKQIVPEALTGSNLFTVDATTATSPVTYENTGRELANAFRLTRLQARSVSRAFGTPLRSIAVSDKGPPLQTHSGIQDRRSTYRLEREQVMTTSRVSGVLDDFLDPLFDLAGDGAQVGTVNLVPTSDGSPAVGDTILVDLDSLKGPNPGTAARSGQRAAVVLERRRTWSSGETAVEIRFWDLGQTLNSDRSHGDAESHADSHGDAAHLDVAHSDATHSDSSHSDTHSDASHEDVAHEDVAHEDHSDSHLDEGSGGAHLDHDDAGNPQHDDSHTDEPHEDVSHTDAHGDTSHSDSAHGDSDHEDGAHSDAHGDDSHVDDPHGDHPHADGHDDIPHGDSGHGDAAHGDSSHDDQPHEDHTDDHSDAHLDESGEVHGDEHSDHTDSGTGTHDDVTHDDAAHSDVFHSDTAHLDHSESDEHDDVSHSDDAHSDGHTDVPHNDLAA